MARRRHTRVLHRVDVTDVSVETVWVLVMTTSTRDLSPRRPRRARRPRRSMRAREVCSRARRRASEIAASTSAVETARLGARARRRGISRATAHRRWRASVDVDDGVMAREGTGRGRFTEHVVAGYEIEGISVGGQQTSVIVPRLSLCFDSGRCPQRSVYADHMCVSHTHMDHIGGCGMYVATRGLLKLSPPKILLPKRRVDAFATFMDAMRALDDSELRHEAIGIDPGERFAMSKLFEIAPFKTTHPVPSQGYIVYGTKQKLKSEYAGLDGGEIKKLRENGVIVTDKVEVPEVAFTGDTTAAWIDDPANVDALRAKLLIMECTFVDDSVSKEDAEEYGHTHIDDLISRADKFENEGILLIHFSARYKAEEVRRALEARLPKKLFDKTTPMLVGYD